MQDLPKIGLVVPSYNQGRFLEEALSSIFDQNYPNLEVAVIDGGSTDNSVEIIRRYESKLVYWRSEPDGGQSAAINEGMNHCQGEVVGWLNSDDFYHNDSLWTLARAFRAHPDRGLYIGNGMRYTDATETYAPFARHHMALNRHALLYGLDYILQPATFFSRRAWDDVGGLDESLRFCMDWDLFLRISRRWPAVIVNEYLACSREYEETKTASGRMVRVEEIRAMIQKHTGEELSPGTLYYFLETILDVAVPLDIEPARHQAYASIEYLRDRWKMLYGGNHGFPEQSDERDEVYLQKRSTPARRDPIGDDADDLPTISIVVPSYNQVEFLEETLESIDDQAYSKCQTIVVDGASTDGSLEVLERWDRKLHYWVSEPDEGPAHAINKGFTVATGDIVGWLASDDLLSADALRHVAKAFADNPDLDMVYGNALYIDEEGSLFLADHGTHKTGLYYGEIQSAGLIPAYWKYVHAVPQPTVFFRRRLLEQCGMLDTSYHFIFDFELFFRFVQTAKIEKIERVQAFYRIHASSKTSDWSKFLVELFRFSRLHWPGMRQPGFAETLRDYVDNYMGRTFGGVPRDNWYRLTSAFVGFCAATGMMNPEAIRWPGNTIPRLDGSSLRRRWDRLVHWGRALLQKPEMPPTESIETTTAPAPVDYAIESRSGRFRAAFCSFFLPLSPGHSGGEIRDFHMVRKLLSFSRLDFFALYDLEPQGRDNVLDTYLESYRGPKPAHQWLARASAGSTKYSESDEWADRYHRDAAVRAQGSFWDLAEEIESFLRIGKWDFLFVSPQSNPIALSMLAESRKTRLVMASYDVESVRIERLAASTLSAELARIESERARRFETDNLEYHDGIISVSQLDKDLFVERYNFPPERIFVLENSVDQRYFSFEERQRLERPTVTFVGNLGYPPNHEAALRLVNGVFPAVREKHPDARLVIVGAGPAQDLIDFADGDTIVVTGRVEDVRVYLANTSVICAPLQTGSGTKYKILEAMSAGVPVCCTPLAAEGLSIADGEHVLIRQTDGELAEAISQVITQPEESAAMARRARALIDASYTWDANLEPLEAWLEMLQQLPLRGRSSTERRASA
ncbi:Hyaluronan synthase [Planctomycetes bacterium Pan216]|uniref:Hyaluronan synthase n=1 Tax=Kolteria novifilia TaxID=2527975 RepID=A0A518B215_9BACT|nr:Hyaluronan synthase [Planctomycetes bacterium Pan216]